MIKMKIRLDTISKVKEFDKTTRLYSGDKLIIKQGEFTIDAYSIMGIMSLNNLEDMYLYYEKEHCDEAALMFGKWEVK